MPMTMMWRLLGALVCVASLLPGIAEGGMDDKEVRSRLRNAALRAETSLRTSQAQLKTFTVANDISGYKASEVAASLHSAKAAAEEFLSDDQLAPFRSYLNVYFPAPTEKDKGEVIYAQELVLISVRSTMALYANAYTVTAKLRAFDESATGRFPPVSLDLEVVTRPSGAVVTLQPTIDGRPNSTTSDSWFKNLYRGYYNYSVRKSGFKHIRAFVNLIDDQSPILECSLTPLDTPDDATPCIRRR